MTAIGAGMRSRVPHLAALLLLAAVLALPACQQKTQKSAANSTGVTAASAPVPAVAAPPAGSSAVPAAGETVPSPDTAPPDTDNAPDGGLAVDIGSVAIAADPSANGGATTEVDVVLALDPAAAQEIAKLSAAAWFDKRGTYANDRAQVMSWNVAAGTSVPETPVDAAGAAKAAFVFAHYKTPGDHRQQVDGEGSLAINLGAKDFTAEVVQ